MTRYFFVGRRRTNWSRSSFYRRSILEQYGDFSGGYTNEYVTKNRDLVLEALSDSGTVAPLIMTANLHSRANPKSYMYVFSHPKAMQDYSGVSTFLFTRRHIHYGPREVIGSEGTPSLEITDGPRQ